MGHLSTTSSISSRLLIIGGDDSTTSLLVSILENMGEILYSAGGQELLSLIRDKNPDIMLLNAGMRGTSGIDLCASLRKDEACSHIPIILVLDGSDTDSETRSLQAGAVDIITKPLNPLVVQARVKAHLCPKSRNDTCERRMINIYRALSAVNEAMLRLESSAELFPLVCKIAVEYGGMQHAWVGVPDLDDRFIPVASYGKLDEFVDKVTVLSKSGSQEGRGPAGIAFRESRSVIVNDVSSNELTLPWREKAGEYGIKAISTHPILRTGNPYAVLVVYSDQTDAFGQEIVQLLEEMAFSISFALDNFDRETMRRKSEEQFHMLFESAVDGIFIVDSTGRHTDVNVRGAQLLSYSKEEILNLETADIVSEIERVRVPRIYSILRAGISVQSEFHFLRKDGSTFPGEISAQLLPDGRIMSIMRDATKRKKVEEELKLAAMVYRISSEGMMIFDGDSKIIAVNPAYSKITGYTAEEVVGKRAADLRPDIHDEELHQAISDSLNATGYWQGEMWNRHKNGELFAISLSINTTFNADGTVHRRVVLFSDITSRKQSEEMLWQQANFDSLTGLPNRSLFRDHLNQEIRKAKRTGIPMALMFLDLDGFKDVNDTLGHDMGDILLKEAAYRLQGCVREVDTVARLGGDEFTVILSELQDPGNVDRVARHILQRMSAPFKLGDEIAHVSASIGITLYPQDGTEIEDLLKNADQAMYAAKHEGRNRYHYFTASMQEAAQVRMRLVNDLRVALEGNQFEVVYQPIVELSSGIIHKAEALIRWRHPTRGMINPLEFIPLAEDTGMIVSFGNWVFHEAARQAAQWRERHHPGFQISVNISPVQFRNEGIDSSTWFEHLNRLGLPAQGIVVEITEGLLLEATEKVTEQLLRFRDAGIEVALDDFGVGYSSLSYLKKFDIDYLKIDPSVIHGLAQESDDLALCEAIIVMAHKLGIKVIAEGVNTVEQLDLLVKAGCDYGQGYHFSHPIPASELDHFIHASTCLCNAIHTEPIPSNVEATKTYMSS
jgi:diguanylate cyclase (GGDEF)-like protein/PAS domain S-box-containing protein